MISKTYFRNLPFFTPLPPPLDFYFSVFLFLLDRNFLSQEPFIYLKKIIKTNPPFTCQRWRLPPWSDPFIIGDSSIML